MKIYELDLNCSSKLYEDGNGNIWIANWGNLCLATCTQFSVWIEEYYSSLSIMFELTFEEVGVL